MVENINNELYEPRINIPKESIAYTRLVETQSVIKELKNENPEILSLCVFGSNIKEISTYRSDIDGWLFVDSELVAKKAGVYENEILDEDIKVGISFKDDIETYYDSLIQSQVQKRLNLFEEQVVHLRSIPLSKKILDHHLMSFDLWAEHYLKDSTSCSCLNTGYIPYIFHMAIGRGVEYYRSYLVNKLLNMGNKGEVIWTELIDGVQIMEKNFKTKTSIKYPQTISQAKEMYLT